MGLSQAEKETVLGLGHYNGENSMLTDTHITEFNRILQSQSNFSMQSTLFLQLPFLINPVPLDQEYIQILFSGNNNHGHWICIYYSNYIIHVYDSLNQHSLNDDQIKYIRKLFPYSQNIEIVFENVQFQINSYDCGVYAIAFVISIIFNLCPCTLNFSRTEMRKHLLKIFNDSSLSMFPLLNSPNTQYSNSSNRQLSHSQFLQLNPLDNFYTVINFQKHENKLNNSNIETIIIDDVTSVQDIKSSSDTIFKSSHNKNYPTEIAVSMEDIKKSYHSSPSDIQSSSSITFESYQCEKYPTEMEITVEDIKKSYHSSSSSDISITNHYTKYPTKMEISTKDDKNSNTTILNCPMDSTTEYYEQFKPCKKTEN